MENSNKWKSKIIGFSIMLIVLGFGIMFLGYGLSGFNIEKYQNNEKRWYQVITIPKD